MKVSPLGVLAALVIVGITIEAVERKSKNAAYALVLLLLLGMITFNSAAFTRQIQTVIALLNQTKAPARNPTQATATPLPQTNAPATNPGAKPRSNQVAATATPFK